MAAKGDRAGRQHTLRLELVGIRRALTVIAVLAVTAALYLAQGFFMPVLLALVLALVLRPIARALQKSGLPAPVGAALIVMGLASMLGAGVYALSEPAAQWVADAPRIGRQLEWRLAGVARSASAIKDVGEKVEKIAKGETNADVQEVVVKEPGLLTQAATGAPELVASMLLVAFLLYFLLATADMFLEKAIRLAPSLSDRVRAVAMARTIERQISRYLLTVTAINLCLGAAIAAAMALTGMPNPILWGAMAALLNFVPYVGAVVGAAVVAAVSVVTFTEPAAILAPPLAYLGLSALEGQVATPMALGRSLGMNPVAIFLGVAFWGWLWGAPGAMLAAPLLLILKIVAENTAHGAALAEFLAARRAKPISAVRSARPD